MTVQASGYASNPFITKTSNEKIDAMKAEQEKKTCRIKRYFERIQKSIRS